MHDPLTRYCQSSTRTISSEAVDPPLHFHNVIQLALFSTPWSKKTNVRHITRIWTIDRENLLSKCLPRSNTIMATTHYPPCLLPANVKSSHQRSQRLKVRFIRYAYMCVCDQASIVLIVISARSSASLPSHKTRWAADEDDRLRKAIVSQEKVIRVTSDADVCMIRPHMVMEIGRQLPMMSRLVILYNARIEQGIGQQHLTTRYAITW